MLFNRQLPQLKSTLLRSHPRYFFGERSYNILLRQNARDTHPTTLCTKSTCNRVSKRSLMSITSALKTAQKVQSHLPKGGTLSRPMGIVVVRQPPIIGDSEKSYENNPICTKMQCIDGEIVKKPVRHPELLMQCCILPGCAQKACTSLCAKALPGSSKAIGHVTHGNPKDAQPFHNSDLSGNNVPENIIIYKKGHPIVTIDDVLNEIKTENMQDPQRLAKLEKLLTVNEEI